MFQLKSMVVLLVLAFLINSSIQANIKFHKKYAYLRKTLKSLGKIEQSEWDTKKICQPKLVVDYYCYTCFCDRFGEDALCISNKKCDNVKPYAMYPDAEISEEQIFS